MTTRPCHTSQKLQLPLPKKGTRFSLRSKEKSLKQYGLPPKRRELLKTLPWLRVRCLGEEENWGDLGLLKQDRSGPLKLWPPVGTRYHGNRICLEGRRFSAASPLPNLKLQKEQEPGLPHGGRWDLPRPVPEPGLSQQWGSVFDESTGVFSRCPDLSPQTSDTLQAFHSSGARATLWLLLLPYQVQKTTLPTPQNGETQTSTEGEGKRSALFLAGDFFRGKPHVGCLPSFHFSEGAEAPFRDTRCSVCVIYFSDLPEI